MRGQVDIMRVQMVTKDDLAAIKEQVATKKDLAELKDQVAGVEMKVARIETRVDLIEGTMATKDDLARTELKLDNKVTVIRGDTEHVQVRLD